MGKVYDALRRAEAQRTRRAVGASAPVAPAPWSHEDRVARVSRRGSWRRWLRGPAPVSTNDAGAINKRRIALLQPDSFVAEQFRSLRARIDAIAAERPTRTIAVTSALPGEGKTLAAVNLALVTAMSIGRRVLLVDCDLRTPGVQQALGLRPEAGIAEVLTGAATLPQALQKIEGADLDILAVRGQPHNPSELLASDRMRSLIEEFANSYDRVILDTPATLTLPDAKTVSELSDGIVLVVRADATQEEDVTAALEILERRRILGLVLNGVDSERDRHATTG